MHSINRKRKIRVITLLIVILLIAVSFFYIRKSVFLMNGYSRLALSYQKEGEHKKAILYRQKAVTIAQRRSNSRSIVKTILQLADSYRVYKKYKQEASCYRELLKLTPKKNKSELLDLKVKLAIAYQKNGQDEESSKQLEEALDLYAKKKQKTGRDDLLCAKIYHQESAQNAPEDSLKDQNITLLILKSDKNDILIHHKKNLEKALATRKRILGNDHLDTADTHYALGFLCIAMEKHTEAIHYLEECWRIREQKLGKEHRDSIQALFYLTSSYVEDKQYNKAKDLAILLMTNTKKATWVNPIIDDTSFLIVQLEKKISQEEEEEEEEEEKKKSLMGWNEWLLSWIW
jgi:tetratricopeptide (TPR) repeat protein